MYERGIALEDVRRIVETGETIREYGDERPFPTRLILGWIDSRPLHVLVAHAQGEVVVFVITVYEPDPQLWDGEFRQRRRHEMPDL